MIDARAIAALKSHRKVRPIEYFDPLPGQAALMADTSQQRLLRGPNQAIGKTTCGLIDLVEYCTGLHIWTNHPDLPFAPEVWILCASFSQSVAIQAKLWDWLPKDLVHPSTSFNPANGFRGKTPMVRVLHVPTGEYAIIRFKTTSQSSLDLAGATIQYALFDEPPHSQRVFAEVQKRVLKAGSFGRILICMTPINARVDWIRDLAESGGIVDHHRRLLPEELIHTVSGAVMTLPDGTRCDQAWCEEVRRRTLPHEIPVVCDGEWEVRTTDGYFEGAWHNGLVTTEIPEKEMILCFGVDHGDRPGKQCAYLVAVDPDPDGVQVWVLAEYVDVSGVADPDTDARGIVDMLHRWSVGWGDLDYAHGDRVHMPGTGQQKSNRDLELALCRAMKLPTGAITPRIRTVKRGRGRSAGSVEVGSRWLFRAMVGGRFHIHPQCARLLSAIPRYSLRDDDAKDPIDALRYALDPFIFRIHRGARPQLRIE